MRMDIWFFHLFNDLAGRSSFFDGVIVFFASYLAYILVAFFAVLVFLSHYSKREKWELFLIAGISSIIARFGVTELIRFFYHRPRPFSVASVHQLLTDTAWSFPSGHAAFFFAMAMAIFLYNRKWGIWFFAAAVLITISRVIAGVHYPSDILGGALIGIFVAYVVFFVTRKIATSAQK